MNGEAERDVSFDGATARLRGRLRPPMGDAWGALVMSHGRSEDMGTPLLAALGQRAADLGLQFHAELEESALPIRIAEMQLKQLLTNLLDNAIQFTAAGRAIRFTTRRKENVVEFEIRDEGTGIEPELLPKIFDRFFTTANPRTGNRGTGLGLAIAKSIATASGGTISVDSGLGRGSIFVVRLPAA